MEEILRLKNDGIILQQHYVPVYEALKRSISHEVAFLHTTKESDAFYCKDDCFLIMFYNAVISV